MTNKKQIKRDTVRKENFFSEEQIEKFKQDPIWREIADTISERIELVRDDFESPNNAEERTIAHLQGELQSLRFVLALLETLRQPNKPEPKKES